MFGRVSRDILPNAFEEGKMLYRKTGVFTLRNKKNPFYFLSLLNFFIFVV